jgi:hypothetical protein
MGVGDGPSGAQRLVEYLIEAHCLVLINVLANADGAIDDLRYSLGAIVGFAGIDDGRRRW